MLTIHHETIYRYRVPMVFGVHKLMVRPRESRTLRLMTHELELSPASTVAWDN